VSLYIENKIKMPPMPKELERPLKFGDRDQIKAIHLRKKISSQIEEQKKKRIYTCSINVTALTLYADSPEDAEEDFKAYIEESLNINIDVEEVKP